MNSPRLEQRIRERIRDFDIPALLSLLAAAGYGEDAIEYRSHRTLAHQGHLVDDIQFLDVPRRRVILTVNLGLLGVQSPLPMFLLRQVEHLDPAETERMERLLGYFDHALLRARFAGLHPERDSTLLPGWEAATRSRLSLMNLTSPSTLHWLFSRAYPEAEVSVRREVYPRRLETRGAQVSATRLGDTTAMGGFASVPTGGVEITLVFDDCHCGTGIPWALEAPRRLSQGVLPLLARTSAPLGVWMVLREPPGPARLQQDSYLGHTPLMEVEPSLARHLLFRGTPPVPGVAAKSREASPAARMRRA
ncbi:type VI secretion system baseplate subunit TssG [Myxococcus sp. K38C18041901]|uniref:type VI secretion system baseplate subunit TssG n=1 Tax=Myxococcus guangdongensis TaxID=2906760 RepID=UPI0020A70D0F|nr:type VI secretion system baseplate subunit TssG [Myxococcus guangdongensis]MCP3064794.1 type VI secretion system baseplate subunit TssG [Myxococcus guangdongensis]